MATRAVKEFEVHPYVQFMSDRFGAYDRWIESEGLPVVSGSHVQDVRSMELGAWPRRGGKGAYLSFSDQRVADGYVCEIAAGRASSPSGTCSRRSCSSPRGAAPPRCGTTRRASAPSSGRPGASSPSR